MIGHRHVKRIGPACGGRVAHDVSPGPRLPPAHRDVVDAGLGCREGQLRVRVVSAVRVGVVVERDRGLVRTKQSDGAVEGGSIDVEGDRGSGGDREGIVFEPAVGCGDDRRVRDGRRGCDRGVGQKVKPVVQRNGLGETAVGQAGALDDVGRASRRCAGPGDQDIVPGPGADDVIAAVAVQPVIPGTAGQDIGMDGPSDLFDGYQGVRSGPARRRPGREVDGDAGRRAGVVRRIDPGAAVQHIVARPAHERVVAVLAVQGVVAGTAFQQVVPTAGVDRVVAAPAVQLVIEGRAGHDVVGDVTADDQTAGRSRRDRLVGKLQKLDIGDRVGAVRSADRADPSVPRHRIGRARTAEHNRIDPQAAVDHIVSGPAPQGVVGRIADDRVTAVASNGRLDDGAERDRDIADQPAHVGEGPLPQVDDLVLGVAGEVERIIAPGVPDGKNQRRTGVDRLVPGAAGVGVEPIDRVTGPGGHIGPVQPLGRRDIVEQRCRGKAPAEGSSGVGLGEIAHHRILSGILVIARIGRIAQALPRSGVVGRRVRQSDRMTDLVRNDLEPVAQRHGR